MDITTNDRSKIALLYVKGNTLREIGKRYEVSGEWIRLILVKMGINSSAGGGKLKGAKNKAINNAKKIKEQEERYMRIYGCCVSDFKKIIGLMGCRRATKIYKDQRISAKNRGIEWRFTFYEWANLWIDSGKWHKRGRHIGEYCMCRKKDIGPYSASNIYIDTVTNNILDGFENRGILVPRSKS